MVYRIPSARCLLMSSIEINDSLLFHFNDVSKVCCPIGFLIGS